MPYSADESIDKERGSADGGLKGMRRITGKWARGNEKVRFKLSEDYKRC
jgi:hypothetical protein